MFDAVISIAVIHHFSNKILRQQAIKELLRISKSKGLVLIYVWAMEQEEKTFNEQDVFVPWNLQFKYEDEKVINQEVQQQFKIDDQKKTVVYKRYYHVFKQGEIEELLSEMEGFKILSQNQIIFHQLIFLQSSFLSFFKLQNILAFNIKLAPNHLQISQYINCQARFKKFKLYYKKRVNRLNYQYCLILIYGHMKQKYLKIFQSGRKTKNERFLLCVLIPLWDFQNNKNNLFIK